MRERPSRRITARGPSRPALISGRSSDTTTRSPSREAARDLGEVPVAQPQLERLLDEAPALEHEHLPALEQGGGGHAQHAVPPAQDDLDVGRGAGQQRRRDRGVVELHLDLDRAVLLQAVEHVGGDRTTRRGEVLARARVDGDARRLARLERPESTSSIGALT